jgi:hypothetical protein
LVKYFKGDLVRFTHDDGRIVTVRLDTVCENRLYGAEADGMRWSLWPSGMGTPVKVVNQRSRKTSVGALMP